MVKKIKTVDAIAGVPEDGDSLVVQLYESVEGGGQWGEIANENGCLLIRLYPRLDGNSWQLNLDDVIEALKRSRDRLA